MLFLNYESEDFPTTVLPNGQRRLSVTWDDVLWAAVTVGRPDLFHVFRHGEAATRRFFGGRWFVWPCNNAVQEDKNWFGPMRSTMDPTEKGTVNYFFGLVACKLFASKLLDAPWTLHLDVFRDDLNPQLLGGRSRPDMVAQSASSRAWHAFECKGRASVPGSAEKQKAKEQAQRLVSVGGTNCTLHVGAITFFRNDTLEVFWRDPEPAVREPIEIPDPERAWWAYYSPFIETIRSFTGRIASPPDAPTLVSVEELD